MNLVYFYTVLTLTVPAAHRTSCDPENPSRLGLRKPFLNGLNNSPAKVFLGFPRQRASILFSHARHTNTLPIACHLYYAPISNMWSIAWRNIKHDAGGQTCYSLSCVWCCIGCGNRSRNRRSIVWGVI